MSLPSTRPTKLYWLSLGVRILLGLLLVFAAFTKWRDPSAFVQQVSQYQLLPHTWVPGLSLLLIGTETIIGLLLIVGIWSLETALANLVLFGIFLMFVVSVYLRKLDLNCGCLSYINPSQKISFFSVLFNLFLLMIAMGYVLLQIYLRKNPKPIIKS